MKNNSKIYSEITFWDNGVKRIYIPVSCLSEDANVAAKLFMEDPWCDECMGWLFSLEEELCEFVSPYKGDEDFSWNPYYCDSSKRNILEIIILDDDKKEVLYSFLNYIMGGNVLRAEDFLFKHKIPKSSFESYLLLRHASRNKTLFDFSKEIQAENELD